MSPLNDAASIYNERFNQRRQSLKPLLRLARVVGYMRGAAGLSIAAMVWIAAVPHLVSGWATLVPAAAFLALHKYYEDTHRELNRAAS